MMADDNNSNNNSRARGGGGGGGGRPSYNNGNNRKRRYRDENENDHHDHRRPQRRRYEEPLIVRVRKQLRSIADSAINEARLTYSIVKPLKKTEDEIASLAQTIGENYFDDELQTEVYDILLQIVFEQPIKIPFAAAIVLIANTHKPEVTQEILSRAGAAAQKHLDAGAWREFKLVLRFLGLLQGLFEGDGVFAILDELFSRAVDLQTASSEDALGLELVKIILLTIPYALASSPSDAHNLALALLEKTDIIASTPHALEALVEPLPGNAEDKPHESASIIGLLQKQLQTESSQDWPLACIPRPWKMPPQEDGSDPLASAKKHAFPSIVVPDPLSQKSKPMFPELYLSVYADQEVESVPPPTDVASSLLRDALADTINILDFNRHATARFLADVDCYFAPGTFVKRATPFDKLKDVAGDGSSWKPEDVAVDAVFSQILQLPMPEHKLVYYHSVLTEACKIAPAAVAPSLGRAIRYAYRNVGSMDLELAHRFLDWFSHHLSNFGFTWKWTEWIDDVGLSDLHPRKAFIVGALDKEIRLSFAQRIRGTLPEAYQELISPGKEKDTPDFKYDRDETPFKEQAQAIVQAIRKREPDEVLQGHINAIHELAEQHGLSEPLVASTDAFMTSICFVGSKSLSHVLSCIERCKDRLLDIGRQSVPARKQIITSVMGYWHDQPGVGVNIVDKLLNYTILTPVAVIEWVLLEHHDAGAALARSHMYEMVSMTVAKVSHRVRQVLTARLQPRADEAVPAEEQARVLDETLQMERAEQARLFGVIGDALVGFAEGNNDEMIEADHDGARDRLIREWGVRWLRVFRRKAAVEEAFIGNELAAAEAAAVNEGGDGRVEGAMEGGMDDGDFGGNAGAEGADVGIGEGGGSGEGGDAAEL